MGRVVPHHKNKQARSAFHLANMYGEEAMTPEEIKFEGPRTNV